MTDLDENPVGISNPNEDDNDPEDAAQDFRLIASLTSKTSHAIPKRGEKDFESHGTKHQEGILAASRQAMHDVLSYTRVHTPKSHIRGFYYGEEGLPRDEVLPGDWKHGLDDDHIVVVESSKGGLFRTMGKPTQGRHHSSLWLLPEEALYLVERGNLDLWWPSRSSFTGVIKEKGHEISVPENGADVDVNVDEGAPMSLQAAYAMLIGRDSERGKISLERYTVYANLKRTGYVALRAPDRDPLAHVVNQRDEKVSEQLPTLFDRLFGRFFAEKEIKHSTYGPLVKSGMYRSYNPIFHQLAIIPAHKPSRTPARNETEHSYRVIFELWKPTKVPTFAKSNPGVPDFRIAVTDSHLSCLPTLTQFAFLLKCNTWDPPKPEWKGPGRTCQRLKHGWRNVLLAVVDQGIISYLRIGEAAFKGEKLFEGFDNSGNSSRGKGGSRGGGRGRGRGRGRDRGRGRGRN